MKRCSTLLVIREAKLKPQYDIISQLSEWLPSKRTQTNVGKAVEKREPCALLVKVYIGAETMEKCMEIPQKI